MLTIKRILQVFWLLFSLSFYGQNDTLAVVRHTDNDLVIPKNLKVGFRGMKNELFIDVPEAKSFEVSGRDVVKKDKNIYTLNPGADTESIVNINITLKNNKKVNEKHVFKIRNLKRSITCFNYTKGDSVIIASKSQFKNAVIRVIPSDKNFNLTHTVTGFSVKIPGREGIVINGDKIDERTYNAVGKYLSKGDEVSIYNIKVKVNNFDGCILISPMIIKIL